jgi:protein-tyrosine phosphatase
VTDFRLPHDLKFDRVANFRDMAGHTTHDGRRLAAGRLLRSGHLSDASDADVERLETFGLRRVFDFRTEADIKQEGQDRLTSTAANVLLPMPDPAKGADIRELMVGSTVDDLHGIFGDGKAEKMMVESAAGLVRERREPYSLFLKALAQADHVPALFHCSAGKDRAGWAGSVVLLSIGVPEDQVIEQYLLSNRAGDEIIERQRSVGNEFWHDALAPLVGVREEYIQSSFDAVAADWGDFDTYLSQGLGVSEDERESLRDNLLE